jgi:uncharacterized protein
MSHTIESLEIMRVKSLSNYKSTKKLISRLGRLNRKKLDDLILRLHHIEFKKIDCLKCANCCKTISPAMNERDIRRMAAAMKLKVSEFSANFLYLDEEGDYVFQQTPCPFLSDGNLCSVYEYRPRACREYPHTDRNRFYQILELTCRNYKVCPVVFNIIEHLRQSSFLK